jgi:hypothetical protein
MKKYLNVLSVLSLLGFMFFCSCDKIEPPYKATVIHPTGDTVRKIILEEFTGHT